MKASLIFKTAFITVATTAFAMSTTAHAQSNNGGQQLLGAAIGGIAGAAIGDGIAPRGRSTEFGIIGGVLGGIAGTAIATDNSNQRVSNGGVYNPQTGYYQPGVVTGGVVQRPVFPTVYTGSPVYSSGFYGSPYYGSGLSINIGSGLFFGNSRRFGSFGSFGGRGFNSFGGRRGFSSFGGRGFNSFGGRRGFSSFGGRGRSFGGVRGGFRGRR